MNQNMNPTPPPKYKRKPGYTRRWQLNVTNKPCDCGNPAVHYFAGPECQRCWDLRLAQEGQNIHGIDYSGILRGTRAERAA